MTDLVGQQLGNYRLTRLLGSGGFAEVYLGEQIYLKREAAIKVLKTQLTQEEMESFLKEARTIAQLEHRHIVQVLEFGMEGNTPFLVMTYAPNGTLRQRHAKGVPLALPIIVSYVKQGADALQYAHNQKFVHRDIKPENMLLSRNDELLISDFGIAVVAHGTSSMKTQNSYGTLYYMAPEQIAAHARPASDQYSLGVVVYEWLTGERPFNGSIPEVVAKQMHAQPPPPHERIPTISAEVEQVVLKALEKDWRARFNSIQDFANALEQATTATAVRPLPSSIFPVANPSAPADPASRKSSEPIAPPPPPASSAPAYSRPPPPPPPVSYNTPQQPQAPVYYTPARPIYQAPPQPPYSNIGYYNPAPPMGALARQPKIKPISYLPLVRGKAKAKDLLLIVGYSILLLLGTVPYFIASFLNSQQGTTSSSLFWLLFVWPSGTLLAGALLGRWRGMLAILIYNVVFFLIGFAQQPAALAEALHTISLYSLIIGLLFLFGGAPAAALVMGIFYERRRTRGCLVSGLIMLLGSVIIAASLGVSLAISTPTPTSSSSASTVSYLNSPATIATFTIVLLIYAAIIVLPAAVLETVIQKIVESVQKKRHLGI